MNISGALHHTIVKVHVKIEIDSEVRIVHTRDFRCRQLLHANATLRLLFGGFICVESRP